MFGQKSTSSQEMKKGMKGKTGPNAKTSPGFTQPCCAGPQKNAKLNDIDHSSLIHSAKEYVPQRLQNKVTSLRRRKNHNVDSRTLGGKRREKSKGFMPTSAAAALFYAGG